MMRGEDKEGSTHIAAAAEWRLMSLLLERPCAGWHEEVAALAAEVEDEELVETAAAAAEATEGEYLAVLGPGGSVSPREVTYQSFADPGHLLAELATIYKAFAFQPRAEDPLDHIAVETGFVGYLLLKEAFAEARGDQTAAATTAVARQCFMETHVAAIAGPFAQRVGTAGPSYLAGCARLVAARAPAPPGTESQPSPADAVSACGLCAGDLKRAGDEPESAGDDELLDL